MYNQVYVRHCFAFMMCKNNKCSFYLEKQCVICLEMLTRNFSNRKSFIYVVSIYSGSLTIPGTKSGKQIHISLQAVSYSTQSQLETQAQVGRGSIAAWDNLQLTWSSSVHDVYCIHVYCTSICISITRVMFSTMYMKAN